MTSITAEYYKSKLFRYWGMCWNSSLFFLHFPRFTYTWRNSQNEVRTCSTFHSTGQYIAMYDSMYTYMYWIMSDIRLVWLGHLMFLPSFLFVANSHTDARPHPPTYNWQALSSSSLVRSVKEIPHFYCSTTVTLV